MMKKIFLILISFIGYIINAQSITPPSNESIIPNIVPPSHQTFSLSKVAYNNSTDGKFHHRVPIFNVDNISGLNVSLNYRSDVKVDDIGNSVGMSWELSYGGVISRIVKDETDEGNTLKWKPSEINEVTDLVKIKNAAAPGNTIDTEYDWFNFSIANGLTGSFYIDENLNAYVVSAENIKIEINQLVGSLGLYGKRLEIKLTDSRGNEYYFGGEDEYIEKTQFVNPGPDRFAVTGWYLNKIITYTKENISFIYDIENINYFSSASANFSIRQQCIGNSGGIDYVFDEVQKTKSITNSFTPRVKYIQTNSQKIEFVYEKDRKDILDEGNNKLLTKIILQNKLNVKQYALDYYDTSTYPPTTYYDISINDKSTISRHFLKSIINLNDSQDRYIFEYNNIDKIPARFSLNTDYYNYYNAKNNSSPFPKKSEFNNVEMLTVFQNIFPISILSADKEVNPIATLYGNLEKVLYPTGGFSQINYEPNYYEKEVKKYEPSASQEFTVNKKLCNVPDKVINSIVFLSNGSNAILKTTGLYDLDCNSDIDNLHDKYTVEIKNIQTGNIVSFSRKILEDIDNYSFATEPNVEYIVTIELKSKISAVKVEAYLTYNFKESIVKIPQYIGGSHISSIVENDGLGNEYTKKYYYNSLLKINNTLSSLVTYSKDKVNIEKGLYTQNCALTSGTLPEFRHLDIYRVYENSLNNDFTIRNNSIFYTNVTEIIEGHSAKETNFSFEDDIDPYYYRVPFLLGIPMSNKGEISRGHVISENHYKFENGAFKIIEERMFKDDYAVQSSNKSYFFKENFMFVPQHLEHELSNISYGFYNNYYGFRKQTKIETISHINSNLLKTTTEYFYDNPIHHQLTKQKLTAPDTTTQETIYQYPHEQGNQYLIDKNIIGVPLETEVKKNGVTVSKSEILYPTSQSEADSRTSGLPLPYRIDSQNLQTNGMEHQVSYDQYDSKGNLLQYTIKSGVPTAIIWGYNQTQPIAKIEGATYAQVSGLAAAIISASNDDANDAVAGNPKEQDLLIALDAFRTNSALSGYQITTYTYDPLIGVRSITPPSGIRETYTYDAANRLQSVKNSNGEILKEYQYHYKP